MPVSVGVGGANRLLAGIWVGVGGAWRAVSGGSVGVGGAWRLVHAAVAFLSSYSAAHTALTPANANARIRIDVDGHVYRVLGAIETDLGVWLPAGNPADYDAFVTLDSGTLTTGSTGTVSLGISQTWHVQRSGLGTSTANLSLSIRLAGTSSEIDSTTILLSATVDI